MLGCQCLRRPRERPCGWNWFTTIPLELVNRYDGAITAHQLDLQPEDRVTCRQNQILIHRTRAEGGVAEEPFATFRSLRKN